MGMGILTRTRAVSYGTHSRVGSDPSVCFTTVTRRNRSQIRTHVAGSCTEGVLATTIAMAARDISVDLAEHVIGFVTDQDKLQRECDALRRSLLDCERHAKDWESRYHRCVKLNANPNFRRVLELEDRVLDLTIKVNTLCEEYEVAADVDFHGLRQGCWYDIPRYIFEQLVSLDYGALSKLLDDMEGQELIDPGDNEAMIPTLYVGIVWNERDKYHHDLDWIPTKENQPYFVFEFEFRRSKARDYDSVHESRKRGDNYRLAVSGAEYGDLLDEIAVFEY